MSERLYPDRQRCKKCGKGLKDIVLDGLYCSYSCGKLSRPVEDIDAAPRQCKMERDNKWLWKQKYRSESDVPERFKNDPSTNIYRCSHCHFLHIGHSRALSTEKARLILDSETLGSFMIRVRESRNETRKDVASKLKIRPIRIKEIEEGSDNIDVKVMFALLKYYRMKMNIVF